MMRLTHSHWRSHLFLFLIVVALLLVNIASIYLSAHAYKNRVHNQFLKTFEKQSLAQLDTYHASNEALIKDFYAVRLANVAALAQNPELHTLLQANNQRAIERFLDQQRSSHNRFTSYSVFDAKGTYQFVASEYPDLNQFLGRNYAERDYIKRALQTKQAIVAQIIQADSGRVIQIFAAPVVNKTGTPTHIVTGAITLERISELTNMTSSYADYYSLLTDRAGNVILDTGQAPQERLNLLEQERAVAHLLLGHPKSSNEEINYRGEKVFYKASAVDLDPLNQVYLVSFFPKAQFDEEISTINSELDMLFFENLPQALVILIASFSVLIWLFKRHEKEIWFH